MKIEELDLLVGASQAIRWAGIDTVEELLRTPKERLLEILPNDFRYYTNEYFYNDIVERLKLKGLEFPK